MYLVICAHTVICFSLHVSQEASQCQIIINSLINEVLGCTTACDWIGTLKAQGTRFVNFTWESEHGEPKKLVFKVCSCSLRSNYVS